MKTAAVIAEFNPFHNGHKYLLEKAKNEVGADAVIAVMSGNWVQRGDAAIISKFSRAKQALLSGFDLVVELPTCFAMSSAQHFAEGSIDIIEVLKADVLVFGSECGDLSRIMRTVYCTRSPEFKARLRELLDGGMTVAKARETAAEELCGNGELLRSPNDTLAVEYVNAAKSRNSKMSFTAVKRKGAAHDGKAEGDICSASAIRDMILSGSIDGAEKYMPPESFEILKADHSDGKVADLKRLDKVILSVLRTSDTEELKNLPDVSEGIEHRIKNAANLSGSFDDIMKYTATKRYTNARLRRLILSAALREKADAMPGSVPYIRVLGCDRLGAEVLKNARETAGIPLVMRSTSLKDDPCFSFEARATDIYSLAMAVPDNCGTEFSKGIIKFSDGILIGG